MNHFSDSVKISKKEYTFIAVSLILALLVGLLAIYTHNYFIPFIPVIILAVTVFLILLFREPFWGVLVTLTYCFFMSLFQHEIGGDIPYGIGIEVLLILTWISVWYNADKYDLKLLKSDFVKLTLIWFLISMLELINPEGASPRGWLQEIRGVALLPLLIAPLGLVLFNSKKRMNIFLVLILLYSLLGSLNGIKQIEIGLSPGEQAFLKNGGDVTHIVNGQLRVFSFYSDASQFGPSQAQMGVIALVLGIGLKGWFKKICLIITALLAFYGMLISGTRGAFFVLLVGVFLAIFLSKNIKAIIIGGSIAFFLFGILKFTYIGNSNYSIYRLRSAVDPQDASFNVRLVNQKKLSDYMATRPFGAGLGTIGTFGSEYNKGSYLAAIAPDSYWVKVWVMYGIIGFIIFFSMWMYLLGITSAMVWGVKDKNLRLKLIALVSSGAGIFICSYGNEVMNAMPSSIILQLSLAIVYNMCARYKKETELVKIN